MNDSAPTGLAWIDGAITPLADARIPITDHGLLYGDGLFEGSASSAAASSGSTIT